MKQQGMVIASEKEELFKYNTKDQKKEWRTKFEKSIVGISRIEDFVFVSTTRWGKIYTTLVDYHTGEKKWSLKKILYNIHILEDTLLYLDTSKEIVSLSIETGEERFRVKTGFRWTSPKMTLLGGNVYLFSSKKTLLLNQKNGALTETQLTSKLNSKEITFIIDEFQMNINTLGSADTGHYLMHDGGGGDASGGDASGGDFGGDAGGGGE